MQTYILYSIYNIVNKLLIYDELIDILYIIQFNNKKEVILTISLLKEMGINHLVSI